MSQPELQYTESVVSRFNFSNNKASKTSDLTYINILFDHDIVINLLKRKIPRKLKPIKKKILQERFLPQLNNLAIFTVINVAKKFTYNSQNLINKIFKTPIFPLSIII